MLKTFDRNINRDTEEFRAFKQVKPFPLTIIQSIAIPTCRPPWASPVPGWVVWCRVCRRVEGMGWGRSGDSRASARLWCRLRRPPRRWCTVRPSGSCVGAPVQPSGRAVSGAPDSSYTRSCRQWRRAEFARGCSAQCWSTSRPWPWRNAGSCSRWVWGARAPSKGCLPSSSARPPTDAAVWYAPCSA